MVIYLSSCTQVNWGFTH